MSEILEYLSKISITYAKIREYILSGILVEKYPELDFIEMKKFYLLFLRSSPKSNAFIFKNKLKVKLNLDNNLTIEYLIDCHLEINELIKDQHFDIKNIFINNDKSLNFEENISHLDECIINDTLYLNKIVLEIPSISKERLLRKNKSYNPLELSKFFYDYFPYEDKNNMSPIEYFESEEREKIYQNIFDLFLKEELRKFKLTGPSSNGKSFTLFFLSRCYIDMVYVNLKIIKNKEKDMNIQIIISELSRLSLSDEKIKLLNEDIKKNVNRNGVILKILLEILELILKYEDGNLILILDQYKNENYDSYPNFMKQIDILMTKYKRLKIIICSSINDNNIRDDVIISLENNIGNPKYDINNQNYLFYYGDLYKIKSSNKNTINYLFGNKQKYISFFKNKEKSKKLVFQEITEKITEKLESFRVSKINTKESHTNYTFNDILIYLNSLFYEKFENENLIKVLRLCPLKYTKIIFQGKYFIIKPLYPFIKYYLNHLINKDECENYFQKKKYNYYTFQSHRIKADYFEFSVQQGLKNNDFFKLPDKEFREINLYEISKMNRIIDLNFDLLGEYDLEKKDEEKFDFFNEKVLVDDVSLNENKIKEKFIPLSENEAINYYSESEEIKKQNVNISSINNLNDLNENDDYNITTSKDNSKFIKELLNKFKYKDTEIIKKDENNFNDFFSDMANLHDLSIDDYRNELIKKYSNYTENKKEIDQLVEQYEINANKYKGDENIYLTQSKENGECVDYAILFGDKNEKSFISFQMKCYGSSTKIKNEALNKAHIKEKLKNILINSMALFNCQIKNWYYYLIFYFNKNDTEHNNLSYKEIEHASNSNIAFLLYNPEEKKFYYNNKEQANKLELNDLANLDYDDYSFNKKNFCYLPNLSKKILTHKEIQTKFINDLRFLLDKEHPCLKDIIDSLLHIICAVDSIKLEACIYSKRNIPLSPINEKAFIYKAKKGDNCFAIVNLGKKEKDGEPNFDYYNLKKKTKCKVIPWSFLCLQYYYVLSLVIEGVPKKSKVRRYSSRKKKVSQKNLSIENNSFNSNNKKLFQL